MSIFKISVLLISIILLSACSAIDYPTAHRHSVGEKIHTFSYTADLRATHIVRKDADSWICMEPAPDAAFSYDDEDDIDVSLISIGGGKEEAKASEGSEDLPLTGRTSYVLLARELNYRICEMAANTSATFEQYFKAYQANLAVIQQVASGEAQNIHHKAEVNVSTGVKSSLSYEQAEKGLPPIKGDADATSQDKAAAAPKGLTQANCGTADWNTDDASNPYCDNLNENKCKDLGGYWDKDSSGDYYCYQKKQS